jgi:three-Cys-motif partner protein
LAGIVTEHVAGQPPIRRQAWFPGSGDALGRAEQPSAQPEACAVADNFFDEQSEQSQIKAAIVSKYFWAWAKVITGYLKGSGKKPSIQYIDLFAGPGRYNDQAKSTPILILEQAVADPLFRSNLTAIFNDKNDANSSSLLAAIKAIPGIETLAHEPSVYTNEVGDEIVKMFEELNLVPTLMFVDPWGYKGLSLRLINSVLKDWACECIFFFNYNRINMGLSNSAVKEHMEALFGEKRAAELAEKLKNMPSGQRELTVVEEICQAVKAMGGKFVLPFTFKNEKGTRTSHHLIFVSKHPLGYGIMKEIMARESTSAPLGVPTFAYNPAEREQALLYGYGSPAELEGSLLARFAGRTMTMLQVFEEHNVDTPYIKKNYKDVLTKMELEGTISAIPPHDSRQKRKGEVTFADTVKVTFPPA